MNELRPVGAASRFAPVARNPGTPLTLDWFEDVQVNLSAAAMHRPDHAGR